MFSVRAPGGSLSAVVKSFTSDTGSALSELAGSLLSSESFEELLQSVAELSVRTIAGVTTSGITLSQDGHMLTVASADELAGLLDEQQYERDEGPCLQALYTGEVVEAVDLTVEDRWNGYPAVAVGYGIRSVLSTPLIVDSKPVGRSTSTPAPPGPARLRRQRTAGLPAGARPAARHMAAGLASADAPPRSHRADQRRARSPPRTDGRARSEASPGPLERSRRTAEGVRRPGRTPVLPVRNGVAATAGRLTRPDAWRGPVAPAPGSINTSSRELVVVARPAGWWS